MLARQQAKGRAPAIAHPALTDAETGLANGLHFDLVYSYLFAAGDRGLAFTVMLLSVGAPDSSSKDRPKAIGQKIRSVTRDADLVAHVGGGRYVVLLLGTNLPGARIAADRLEIALGDLTTSRPSFGIVAYNRSMKESSELLEAADRALVAAQEAGGGVELG
ncbi:MAG: diguanylate cyclase [Gemmatimonadales bacterium]